MIVLCCSLQHQLSTTRIECENNTKEIGQHKLTVHQKEEKVKTLTRASETGVSHCKTREGVSSSQGGWCHTRTGTATVYCEGDR